MLLWSITAWKMILATSVLPRELLWRGMLFTWIHGLSAVV
jgi:hypothetical protein